jgi:DNA (cytosine-5)-methyltransferase 1
MRLTFLDLFSGIGGFRYALEQRGHTAIGYSEIDSHAKRTYQINYATSGELDLGNIREIDAAALPNFDLLVGGFPCQSFSMAGLRQGFDDHIRGTLFFEIIRILRDKRPKYFILENVKGLISHDKPNGKGYPSMVHPDYDGKKKSIGRTLQVIEQSLDAADYYFTWQILNTKDYGLPQSRERIFFVGQRKDLGPFHYFFPSPEPLHLTVWDILEDEVDQKYLLSELIQNRLKRRLEAFGFYRVIEGSVVDSRQSNIRLYEGIAPTVRSERHGLFTPKGPVFIGGMGSVRRGMNGQEHLSRAYKQKDRLYHADGIAPTICAQEQSGRYHFAVPKLLFDSYNQSFSQQDFTKTIRTNEGLSTAGTILIPELRRLTPKECFRLQGFPDYFVDQAKAAGIADTHLYRQAGNAVSTNVVDRIVSQLETMIKVQLSKCA